MLFFLVADYCVDICSRTSDIVMKNLMYRNAKKMFFNIAYFDSK